MNRRRFLGLCGVAGVGGATAFTLFDSGVAAGAPSFPESKTGHPRLGRSNDGTWTVLTEDTQTVSGGQFGIDVSASVHTTVFSYDAAREYVAERTRGVLDRPVVLASLTRVDLDSYVNAVVSIDRLEGKVIPAVKTQLVAQGVAGVGYEETTLADDLTGVQRTYDVRGAMPVAALSYDDPDTPDRGPVRVPAFDISVAGVLALWKESAGTVYVLGSVYPDEPVSMAATQTVEGSDGERREVHTEVTLDFDAATYREAVVSLLD